MEMKTIKVSIGKGDKKQIVETVTRTWSKADLEPIVTQLPNGIADFDEMAKLLNYAADLKARAAKRVEFTDVGAKTKNRQAAQFWIMQQVAKGDLSFMQQFQEATVKGTKEVNAYLDELWESTEELSGSAE
jgi:hypothetical protein